MKYCQCKKCLAPFTFSGKTNQMRHYGCGGYGQSIQKAQYDELVGKIKKVELESAGKVQEKTEVDSKPDPALPIVDEKVSPGHDKIVENKKKGTFTLELENVDDEVHFDEMPKELVELPPTQAAVVPSSDSLLGSGLVLASNVIFAVGKKALLSDKEKDSIKIHAATVSEKHPALANLKGGSELELAESVASPFMSRYSKDFFKPKEKDGDLNAVKEQQKVNDSRENRKREDILGKIPNQDGG